MSIHSRQPIGVEYLSQAFPARRFSRSNLNRASEGPTVCFFIFAGIFFFLLCQKKGNVVFLIREKGNVLRRAKTRSPDVCAANRSLRFAPQLSIRPGRIKPQRAIYYRDRTSRLGRADRTTVATARRTMGQTGMTAWPSCANGGHWIAPTAFWAAK